MLTLIEQEPGCGPPAPVPILQWQAEFEVLLALYRKFRPRAVLEVGTYHGGTLFHWLQNADGATTIVSVDSYEVGVDNRHLYDEWNSYGTMLRVLKGNTHDPETVKAVGAWRPFDWVFIDAGHYYHEVSKDWELYRPMVADGGCCVFHDILTHPAWPSIEVGRLWEEIKADHDTFEIVADPYAQWGGIGVVLL